MRPAKLGMWLGGLAIVATVALGVCGLRPKATANTGALSNSSTPGVSQSEAVSSSIGATQAYAANFSWYAGARLLSNQTALAAIIVVGRVVKVGPSRWNSPDGSEWKPDDQYSLPLVYTTFYVAPSSLLKGESKFGLPIPFRVLGGVIGDVAKAGFSGASYALQPNDEVVVFGLDEQRFGPGGSYPPAAYWTLMDTCSVWKQNQKGDYVNQGGAENLEESSMQLSAMKVKVDESADSR